MITNIYPKNLLSGQSKHLTIVGSNLGLTQNLVIGGLACIPFYFVSENICKCIAPSLNAGTYDLYVRSSDGTIQCLPESITVSNRVDGLVLGSSQNPIVLPVRTVDIKQSPVVNTSGINQPQNTSASVSLTSGVITGTKKPVPQETSFQKYLDISTQKINTIYGDFEN